MKSYEHKSEKVIFENWQKNRQKYLTKDLWKWHTKKYTTSKVNNNKRNIEVLKFAHDDLYHCSVIRFDIVTFLL